MKVRDVIRLLEAAGWVVVRTRGSHRQYVHPAKKGLVTIAGKPGHDLPLRETGIEVPKPQAYVTYVEVAA